MFTFINKRLDFLLMMQLTRYTLEQFLIQLDSGQPPPGQGVPLGQLHQLGLLPLKGAVGRSSSTGVIAAEPVELRGNRAASIGTYGLFRAALIVCFSHVQKLCTPATLFRIREAVALIESWSTLDEGPTARAANPVGFRTASPSTIKLTRTALLILCYRD